MKKILSIMLTVMLILSAMPYGAFSFSVSAETDGYYTYEIVDGEAIITYVDDSISGEVTVPSTLGGYPVTRTDDYSFSDCDNITKVVLPEGFVRIGYSTFAGCENITEIVIPDSVESIAYYAFDGCVSLTSIAIPANTSYVEGNAFTGCISLEEIVVAEDNQWYLVDESGVLYNKDMTNLMCCPAKNGVTSYQIPDTVKTIESYAFQWNEILTDITISDSVEIIESYAFAYCYNLVNINVSDDNSIKSIGSHMIPCTAYYNDESNWQDGALYLGNNLINVKETFVGDFDIKQGTKLIAEQAISDCNQITSITVPDSIYDIPNFAFSGCSALEKITLSKNCKTIGQWAFQYCSSLTTLTIPSSASRIDYNAFYGCENLESVYIPYSVTYIDTFYECENLTIYGYQDSYAQHFAMDQGMTFEIWENENIITENNIVYEISDNEATVVFVKNTDDNSIIIPTSVGDLSVTSIAANAFNCFEGWDISVTIPNSIVEIKDRAFYNTWITDVWYEGTEEEKESIVIGEDNDSLICSEWHFVCKNGEHQYSDASDLSCENCDYNRPISEIIKSVTIEPVNIVDGANGYFSNYWDYELQEFVEFYYYEWYGVADAVIELIDGTVINTSRLWNGVEYNGEYYNFMWDDEQHSNPWTVGNTYAATVSFAGITVDVPVTIIESPIKSITVNPVSIIEGTSGGWSWRWDEELQEGVEYFRYYWESKPLATIEFQDGTVIESYITNDVQYNGDYYNFSWIDPQFNDSWTVGNTYYVTASFMGKSVEIPVTITESPVKSVYVEPLSIQECTCGWWTWDYVDGERIDYYRYQWYDMVDVVVEFQDGTTGTYGIWDTITYGDAEFTVNWANDTQYYYNPWTVGNTYIEELSVGGLTADVYVTITEAPYESIEILSVESIKETDYYYIDENGNKHYYIPNFTYKINFKDGTSLIREYYYYYEDLQISTSTSQYDNPWTVGGENLVTVSIGKATATFSVIITEVTEWEYIEQNGGLFITRCNLNESEITVPEEIDGKPVIGIMDMGDTKYQVNTINIPDSIAYISDEAFVNCYNLNSINIGVGITELNPDIFAYCYSLCNINVSEENENFSTVDGVLYNKSGDTLVAYPLGQGSTYYVPDDVVNADVLFEKGYYSHINIEFSENSKAFKLEDGITYNADKTIVIKCDPEKTGDYDMPDTVTTINEFAFSGSSLSSVTVSDNVSEIVYNAFSYCNNLETISLPDTLTSIGEAAFFESNVKNLSRLPSSLTEIGGNAFAGTQMTSVIIPSGVTEIGYNAFAYSVLENATLSEGIEVIGSGAFSSTNLSTIRIPNSVSIMGWNAFAYTPLKSAFIGTGLTEIPDSAFESTCLTEITLPENITYIGDDAFANSDLSKVVFNGEEVYIGNSAFYGCPLDKTTFGNNIVYFGEYAFANNSMTSVKIPDSVTDITYYSFAYSGNLENIDIPDNIESVCGHAFDGTAWYEAQDEGVVYLENVLYHYKGDIPENTEIVVKDGTTVIADYAFEMEYDYWNDTISRDVSGLESVVLPDGLMTIGEYAFYYCYNLEKIVIPASVTNISYYAFEGCDNLIIYGYAGSFAEEYAGMRGIPFVDLNGELEVVSIEVIKMPNKTKYNYDPNFIGAEIMISYSDGSTKIVTVNEDNTTYEYADPFVALRCFIDVDGYLLTIEPEEDAMLMQLYYNISYRGKSCSIYWNELDFTEGKEIVDVEFENVSISGEGMTYIVTYEDGTKEILTSKNGVYSVHQLDNTVFTYGFAKTADGHFYYFIKTMLDENGNAVSAEVDAFGIEKTIYFDANESAAPGDIDADGVINNKDLGTLMRYLNGWDVYVNRNAVDTNGDGKVNNKDYVILQRYINGWDIELGGTL